MTEKVDYSRPYPRVQKVFNKPSLTRASEVAHTDLKSLVERFRISGATPPPMTFADVSSLPNSRLEALNIIEDGLSSFYDLPEAVQRAVGYDPRNLENWMYHNSDLAKEYGLLAEAPPQSSPDKPPQPSDDGEANEDQPTG